MRSAFWLSLALLLAGAAAAAVSETAGHLGAASRHAIPTQDLAVFKLSQLKALDDASVLQRLRDAVFNVGMLAVDPEDAPPSPSTPTPTTSALEALVRCASGQQLEGVTRAVTLADGSSRNTLATSTSRSVAQPLPEAVHSRCPDFLAPGSKVRSLASEAGLAYAAALDTLVHGPGISPLELRVRGLDSFAQAVKQGESLEHFHLFTRPDVPKAKPAAPLTAAVSDSHSTAALHMHTDIGLFIVMTAAEYFAAPTSAKDQVWRQAAEPTEYTQAGDKDAASPPTHPGLYLELPSGQVVRPLFPAGSLLVMSGEACSRWMRAREGATLPPAAPHEVVLPTNMRGLVRAWYGRMFFPLASAKLQTPDTNVAHASLQPSQQPSPTFGQYRAESMAALQSEPHLASTVGCGPTRRLLQDQGACAAGQVYCWMQCMNIPSNASCSKEQIQCKNPAGQLWPQDFPNGDQSHCFDCELTCPNQNVTHTSSGFCNTQLTAITMWMTGFQFSNVPNAPCVAFLFPQWALNSQVKFGFACIGTFLLGVACAALGYTRSLLLKSRLRGPAGAAQPTPSPSPSVKPSSSATPAGCPCPATWGKPVDGIEVPQTSKGSAVPLVAGALGEAEAGKGSRYMHRPKVWRFTHLAAEIFLYAVQMTLAYFLMLIAMTYEAELFIMVVLGLTAGHGILLWVQGEEEQRARAYLSDAPTPQQENLANPEPCCSYA